METLADLQREQIQSRCLIATLYADLLQLMPPSREILNAAHVWTMRHIETLVNDILVNIPNNKAPINPYTEPILLSGIKADDLNKIVLALVEAMQKHKGYQDRIEQVAKGVA